MVKKCGFTLTEIMIVLTIIGVITAIILPIGINSIPNENVMKFKKANNVLGTVIKELVTSENYYLDGDLSKKPDDTAVTADYLCNTMADILSVKSTNCKTTASNVDGYVDLGTISTTKTSLDTQCNTANTNANIGQFTTADNVLWYDANPNLPFSNENFTSQVDTNGFYKRYKVFCLDVDGANFGEAPFGYGIRIDGKILTGTRADTWINKNVQDKD